MRSAYFKNQDRHFANQALEMANRWLAFAKKTPIVKLKLRAMEQYHSNMARSREITNAQA